MVKPEVSVVIPTVGRPELAEAIDSIRKQVGVGQVEIVVAVDKPQGEVSADTNLLLDAADTVLWTGGGERAGRARNLGIDAAKGDWIALLDDDDTWAPSKLANQLRVANASADPRSLVLSSRVIQGTRSTRRVSVEIPATVYEGGRIEDYLFRSRRPSIRRAVIYTSTLLVHRDLARRVPWDSALRRHQDWDWLCRLQDDAGAHFLQIEPADVCIWSGTHGSLSASNDWESSLGWVRQFKDRWNPRTYVDFISAQPLRYAMAARSPRGIRASVKEIRKSRRFPGLGPAIIGLGGASPRNAILRVATRNTGTHQTAVASAK